MLELNTLKRLSAPISVNLEITEQCNLNCFFCFCDTEEYKQTFSKVSSKEKIENIKRILDVLAENHVFEVRLFGGEFSLLKGWQSIVEYARNKDFFVSFVSNGTIFNLEDVQFLVKNEVKSCSISLHGLNEVHDNIVGLENSFRKATSNIRLLVNAGVNVYVPFTPTELNVSYLGNFTKVMVEELGVKGVGVNRLFRSDRYKNLTFSDYINLFETISQLQSKGLPIFFIDSFPICKIPTKYWKYVSNCSQGVGFGQIDYMGNIKNCSSLSVNIGNVFKDDLANIWNKQLTVFRKLEHLPLSCRLCPIFCGGGCIASRTTEKNFIADEFIKLPSEEKLFESTVLLGKIYLKKIFYKRSNIEKPKNQNRQLLKTDIPKITMKFKIRKEGEHYLCMIEERGTVVLNEKSFRILSYVNGENTVDQILNRVNKTPNSKVSLIDVSDVLSTFI